MKSEWNNATLTYEEALRNCSEINSCVKLRLELRAIPYKKQLGIVMSKLMTNTPEVSFWFKDPDFCQKLNEIVRFLNNGEKVDDICSGDARLQKVVEMLRKDMNISYEKKKKKKTKKFS